MLRGQCRSGGLALAGLLGLLAPGCGGAPHAQVMRDQTALYKEMRAILAEIKDPASMEKAKGRLLERRDRFQQVADRGKSLGNPPREFAESHEQLIRDLQEAVNEYFREIRRIQALKLPGGEEFLAEFQQPKSNPALVP